MPGQPSVPGNLTETSALIQSSAAARMQALLPPHNRPAMSSRTKQNRLPWDTQWVTLRTSRQQAAGLDRGLKAMKYLQRRVLLLLCSVIEGCCSDSLSGVGASGSHWRKKKKKKGRDNKNKSLCVFYKEHYLHCSDVSVYKRRLLRGKKCAGVFEV